MKTKNRINAKEGSALVLSIVLLTVASITIGSLLYLLRNNSSHTVRSINRDRAFYLAEDGLRHTFNVLNTIKYGQAEFTREHSVDVFENPDNHYSGEWGFETELQSVQGRTNRIVSTGQYGGVEQSVSILCYQVANLDPPPNPAFDLAIAEFNTGNSDNILNLNNGDFFNGGAYTSGNLDGDGADFKRSEEDLGDVAGSEAGDSQTTYDEEWAESGKPATYEGPVSESTYTEREEWAINNADILYTDGSYDPGEPFLDIGDKALGDGEPSGTLTEMKDYLADSNNQAGKILLDEGSGNYFVDLGNGVYDQDEPFVDDRNGIYDVGLTASGSISDVGGTTADGQLEPDGGDRPITAPDLTSMYYHLPNDEVAPSGAPQGWGHNIKIDTDTYNGSAVGSGLAEVVGDVDDPAHIFIRNAPCSALGEGSQTRLGKRIYRRNYNPLLYPDDYVEEDKRGTRIVDDYFMEDPTHDSYNSPSGEGKNDYGNSVTTSEEKKTAPEFINIQESGNDQVYYIDGNLHLNSPTAYAFRFLNPDTRVTFVVNGNITISDELYYNGTYGGENGCTVEGEDRTDSPNISYEEMNSSQISNPLDTFCLIAMKNDDVDNILGAGSTGNIFLGDPNAGTGGSIHAFLYAENNIEDVNLNTDKQTFIGVYGCMAAGNEIDITRVGSTPTRLDITLDQNSELIPGVPPPAVGEAPTPGTQGDYMYVHNYDLIPGTWQMHYDE